MSKVIYPVIGNERLLPFYLTGIGVSSSEYHIKRDGGLVSHQLLFTKSGRGTLLVGGGEYPQEAGSCFYLAPSVPHEYFPDGGAWETCWIVFRGVNLQDTMQSMGFDGFLCRRLEATDTLQKLFGKIYIAAQNNFDGGYICSRLIYEYILEAKRLLLDGGSISGSGTVIEYALALTDEKLGSDITLEQLSSAAGVSPQHFCRIFKARTGMRPMEYLARRRIAAAKALLDNSKKSASEIGTLVGYPNQSYFGVVFKKYEGISPTEYRQLKSTLKI